MQTFVPEKQLLDDPGFAAHRGAWLAKLDPDILDPPIRDAVRTLNELPYCFTLQSCWGHFHGEETGLCREIPDTESLKPELAYHYRIAYAAFCLENSPRGREFLGLLRRVPAQAGPGLVQFGCADWFWNQLVNTYVLQVQPRDRATVDALDVAGIQARELRNARDALWNALWMLAAERI